MSFTTTDTELLAQAQDHLIETYDGGATIASGLWSIDELVGYLNDRQRQFLRETCVTATETSLRLGAGEHRTALPQDWVATHHAAWESPTSITVLARVDHHSLDYGMAHWLADREQDPITFTEDLLPQVQIAVFPAPRHVGRVSLIYTQIEAALTGLGAILSVPDEFVAGILWGALADALKKNGPAQDLPRAAYCEQRFQEAIAMGKWLMDELSTWSHV